jgi:TRAP-type C4-dicarboxylate transport system permease small subunit
MSGSEPSALPVSPFRRSLFTVAAGVGLVLSLGLIVFGWLGAVWLVALCAGSIAWGLKRGSVREGFAALDDLIFEGEKAIVGLSLIVMSLVVFLDVVWRTAHSLTGAQPYGFAIAIFVLTLIGAFTAKWERATPAKRAIAGVVAYAILAVLCVVIKAAPNGFGWSQTLAMVLLLWVSLIGSSMATKEGRHIAVDAVKKVLPDRFKKGFELVAGLVTVALSSFLAILGAMYCRQNYVEWVASDHGAFLFESIPIPYWIATLPIPVGFGLTAVRFVGVAIYGTKEVDVITSVGAADLEAKP